MAALPQELGWLLKKGSFSQVVKDGTLALWEGLLGGSNVAIAFSGVGKGAAVVAMEHLRARYQSPLVVSLGFAGGLDPDLKAGDLVLIESAIALEDDSNPVLVHLDAPLLKVAANRLQRLPMPYRLGKAFSSPQIVLRGVDKGAIWARFHHEVVDMETFWVVRAAIAHNMPLLAFRSVLDPAGYDLLSFVPRAAESGRPLKEALGYLARRPWRLGELLSTAYQAGKARSALERLVWTLLDLGVGEEARVGSE